MAASVAMAALSTPKTTVPSLTSPVRVGAQEVPISNLNYIFNSMLLQFYFKYL